MGRLAQNSTSRKSNTILYHLFYPKFFVLELLMYISNTYTKSHHDIELGMDPLLYFCAKYFHETYILKSLLCNRDRDMYGTMTLLHNIRTNYYFC